MPIPTPPTKPPDPFVLFVSAREGHIVRRFGTTSSIGHTFTPGTAKDQPSAQHWDTETIHAITADEYALFAKEYDAELVEDGGLERCKREDWEKQRKAATDAKAKAAEERKVFAEKAAKAEADGATVVKTGFGAGGKPAGSGAP